MATEYIYLLFKMFLFTLVCQNKSPFCVVGYNIQHKIKKTCRTLTDICFSKLTVCLNPPGGTNFTLPVLILSLSGRRSNHSYGRVLSTRLVFTVY